MASSGRKRQRSMYRNSLPRHVIEDILARLPVKSLSRFKSVSKPWVSMITSAEFIELHLSNQWKNNSLLLTHKVGSFQTPSFVKDISVYSSATQNIQINNLLPDIYRMSHSCDGIVCFYGDFNIHVFNPSTREFRTLPPGFVSSPHSCLRTIPDPYNRGCFIHEGQWRNHQYQLAIGRDQVTKQYKIVKVFDSFSDKFWEGNNCEIFTLDHNHVADYWKTTGIVPYKIALTVTPIHVNGAIYWFTHDVHHANKSEVIIKFELHRETFQPIPHPSCCSDLNKPRNTMLLGTLKGTLSLAERESNQQINIWLMKCQGDLVTWEKFYIFNNHQGIGHVYAIVDCKDRGVVLHQGKCIATPFTESLVRVYGRFLLPQPQP